MKISKLTIMRILTSIIMGTVSTLYLMNTKSIPFWNALFTSFFYEAIVLLLGALMAPMVYLIKYVIKMFGYENNYYDKSVYSNINIHDGIHLLLIIISIIRLIINYKFNMQLTSLLVQTLIFYVYQFVTHLILEYAPNKLPHFMRNQHGLEALYASMTFHSFMLHFSAFDTALYSHGILFPKHLIFPEIFDYIVDIVCSLVGPYCVKDKYITANVNKNGYILSLPITMMVIGVMLQMYLKPILYFNIPTIIIFGAIFLAQNNMYHYRLCDNDGKTKYKINVLSSKEINHGEPSQVPKEKE